MKVQYYPSILLFVALCLSCSVLKAQKQPKSETWQWVEDFPNLVPNSGFTKLDKNGWASHWKMGNWGSNKGEVKVVKSARSKGQVLRMTNSPYRYVKQIVPVDPSARYFIAFRVRTEFVRIGDGGRGPGIYVSGGSGFYKLNINQRLSGSNDWRYVVLAEEATFGQARQVEVVLENHRGSGTVWIDDIRFVKRTKKWDVRRLQERLAKMLKQDLDVAAKLALEARSQWGVNAVKKLAQSLRVQQLRTEQFRKRAEPPFFPQQTKLFSTVAQLNSRRLNVSSELAIWQVDPFQTLSPFGLVPADRLNRPARAIMGRNETDQIAINLCNIGDTKSAIQVSLPGQKGGPKLLLREVKFLKSRSGVLADPLPRFRGRKLILPPGLFKQLWVMIDSRGVSPGKYSAQLEFSGTRASSRTTQRLQIEVLPVSLPAKKPIVTWGYQYRDWPLVRNRWLQAAQDLADHHINAYYWKMRANFPWPTFDAKGRMEPLNWDKFDKQLATLKNLEWLILWMEVEYGYPWRRLRDKNVPQEKEAAQKELERRFRLWFPAVLAGLKKRGFGPDRVAWSLSDEPCNWHRAHAVRRVGDLVKKVSPKAMIVANPYSAVKWGMLAHMDPVIDTWFPKLNWANAQLLQFFKHNRKRTWSYQVLGRKPAFVDYRRSFWECWRKEMTGQGFWNYAAPGFAVVYGGDPKELIPSVRWEAWREGVEDYTYIWMLREALRAKKGSARVQAEARELLRVVVPKVSKTENPARLASVRERVLRVLGSVP